MLKNREKIFAVAPMMDWTDRHCRAFHRTLTKRARLYTEMVTAQAVVRGDAERLIGFDTAEHPVALQLGGSDPALLAKAAAIGEAFGYDEINLNVGCPSDRVKSGSFGACLMREPERVADCMAAMGARVQIPVTVKCRLGVDDQDPNESLFGLVGLCAAAGVDTFIVHARKAWLQGLSPKENRTVPPLDYGLVHRLKAERPGLRIILNGGLETLEQATAQLDRVDGVMLGRAAYHTPALLGRVDAQVFSDPGLEVGALQAVRAYQPYIARKLRDGAPLAAMTRHMLGLFSAQPGARSWRRILTVDAAKPGAGLEVIERALEAVASVHTQADEYRLQASL
jgi:tRNA-dihydrouridine synthase A